MKTEKLTSHWVAEFLKGLLLLVLLTTTVNGIELSQSIDKTEMAFEELLTLEIVITWSGPQTAYLFQKPLNPSFDRFKIRQFSSSIGSSGAESDEITTRKLKFTLEPLSAGIATIPVLAIEYLVWPDSIPGELVTEMMSVIIAEPLPITKTAASRFPTIAIVFAGFAILVIAAGVIWFVRRRRPVEVKKSPRDMFLECISDLHREAGSDIKKFQTGLIKLLAAYLRSRYKIDLSGLNSAETAAALDKAGVMPADREKFCQWLARAEKEKYSPDVGIPGETARLHTEIRTYFENMQPLGALEDQ